MDLVRHAGLRENGRIHPGGDLLLADSAAKRGIILVALAGAIWSLQGVTIRMIDVASAEQTIFWRSIGQLFVQFALVAALSRGRVIEAFRTAGIAAVIGGFAMTRFPVYFCEIVCDEDEGCRPELYEEQVFKAENDCDEVACTPKFLTEGEEESA